MFASQVCSAVVLLDGGCDLSVPVTATPLFQQTPLAPACLPLLRRWLSGGGWWSVGQTLLLLSCDVGVIVCAQRWPTAHELLSSYILGVSAPLLIAR